MTCLQNSSDGVLLHFQVLLAGHCAVFQRDKQHATRLPTQDRRFYRDERGFSQGLLQVLSQVGRRTFTKQRRCDQPQRHQVTRALGVRYLEGMGIEPFVPRFREPVCEILQKRIQVRAVLLRLSKDLRRVRTRARLAAFVQDLAASRLVYSRQPGHQPGEPIGQELVLVRCAVVHRVAAICLAQSAARSSSLSFSGPSVPFTRNPSGGVISSPPLSMSITEIGLAA